MYEEEAIRMNRSGGSSRHHATTGSADSSSAEKVREMESKAGKYAAIWDSFNGNINCTQWGDEVVSQQDSGSKNRESKTEVECETEK